MTLDRFTRTTLSLCAGLLAWALVFLFVYVFAAVACERGFAQREVLGIGIVPFVSVCAGLLAAGAIAWLLGATRGGTGLGHSEHSSRFIRFTMAASAGLAGVALLLLMLPPLLSAPYCAARQLLQEHFDGFDSSKPSGGDSVSRRGLSHAGPLPSGL